MIDNYILGNVSPQEKQEVECMAHIYPEIEAELRKSKEAFEKYILSMEVKAPENIKTQLFAEIDSLEENTKEAKVRLLDNAGSVTTINYWKYGVAATLMLFVSTTTILIIQKNKNHEQAQQLKDMNTKASAFERQLAKATAQLELQNSTLAYYTNPENKIIRMMGMEQKDPSAMAYICWNTKSKDVFVDVKKLPVAPEGKQYQLWAIVDGKPVDLGVMDISGDTQEGFHQMKKVISAQAFAVTLEKKGGSPVPTMDEMYVIGNV